ncbi:MAG: hypothetical protein WCK98_08050 [bacterium]
MTENPTATTGLENSTVERESKQGSQLQPIQLEITQVKNCIELRRNNLKTSETLEGKFRNEFLELKLQQLELDLKATKEKLDPKDAVLGAFSKNSLDIFGPKIRAYQNFLTSVGANSASLNRFELTNNLFEYLIRQNVAVFVPESNKGNYFLDADAVLKNQQLRPHFETPVPKLLKT